MRRGRTFADFWSDALALAVEAVHVNTVVPEAHAGAQLWVKRRRPGMGAVIAGGNVFLRLSRSRIRMFASGARWRDWELASFRLLYPDRAAEPREDRAVALEALPGERLDRLLERGQLPPAAVEAAARELRRAHALTLPGATQPWSHGDAHLKNVLYDEAGKRAWLIDFETPHEPGLSPEERHADDLLVFLLDLGGSAPEDQAGALAESFLREYAREDVLRALLPRLRPPRGLERALWKTRSHHLPGARLVDWLEHLRAQVLLLLRSG